MSDFWTGVLVIVFTAFVFGILWLAIYIVTHADYRAVRREYGLDRDEGE